MVMCPTYLKLAGKLSPFNVDKYLSNSLEEAQHGHICHVLTKISTVNTKIGNSQIYDSFVGVSQY